jgi:hypothetical protein
MKTLKCSICDADVEVPDSVVLDTCADCAAYYQCPYHGLVLSSIVGTERVCDACRLFDASHTLVGPQPERRAK